MDRKRLQPVGEALWEIAAAGGMNVPGRIYATPEMLDDICRDAAAEQVANVARLPGIVGFSCAMPDIHWGYGFPIGGVAAFDPDAGGVISPGGVGYDINCGVRLLRTDLQEPDVRPRLVPLVEALLRHVPSGLGSRGPLRLSGDDFERVLVEGAAWAVARGHGPAEDLAMIEEGGRLAGADPARPSERARQRGRDQLGTLGSGNHFVEIGVVEELFDTAAAAALGLRPGQVTLMIHSGSRGFGHQVCDDAVRGMLAASRRYGIDLPDKQLCCAPLDSPEGRAYYGAMAAAVNFAFANRQLLATRAREAFAEVLGRDAAAGIETVYEVAHNIAKWEEHVDPAEAAAAAPSGEADTARGDAVAVARRGPSRGGAGRLPRPRRLCVHRKGATRAFGPGHPDVPARYRAVGQPVLIPGDMGRASYVLVGQEQAMRETFGSACHGAGRRMSRTQAEIAARGRHLVEEMRERGVVVRASGRGTIAEEMPEAYKDVSQVVEAVARAGLARPVARLRPVGVIKG